MSELRVGGTEAGEVGPPRRGDPFALAGKVVREPSVQLLASQVLTGVVAMAANILMVRSLSPTHRGEVALMLQVVYLATQVLLLGTERSFVASYHNVSPAPAVRAYARLLAVPCVLFLAGAVIWQVAAPDRLTPGPVIVAMLAWFALIEAISLATRSIAIAVGRVRDFLLARVIEALLLLGMLVGLYVTGAARPEMWFLAYLFAGATPTVIYLIIWLRLPVPAGSSPAGPAQNRQVRREGLSLFPAALSNMAMLRVDRLVIPALASTAALGHYTAVATMTELLAWPVRAYADSRLGRWRASHNDGGLKASPILVVAAVYVLVVVPLVAGGLYLLVEPLFGHEYADAKVVVLPLVVAAGLYAVSRISLGLLIAKGHGGLVSAAEITGFVVSFAVYLLLIPRLGILGAAYGSLAGYGACLVFAMVATRIVRAR
ncbi:NAD(P)H-quinone oxidoreductase [Actinoplanes sp. NEAU-A12]|uniref:NAD(P)H-quinone oxidoreductase n=1 Tax=Actinoplanes sandaracinus TaxID=3045177 RepID=A0ABT6WC41_9ACTN|nr:NAD(P)H-quinone oxidoreductase [Actinoplanes sandaracinus]MDI6097295.1 NAD(P)H-quinone oxidoreductase [Actinoplanes sandaracinus]